MHTTISITRTHASHGVHVYPGYPRVLVLVLLPGFLAPRLRANFDHSPKFPLTFWLSTPKSQWSFASTRKISSLAPCLNRLETMRVNETHDARSVSRKKGGRMGCTTTFARQYCRLYQCAPLEC
eukprot:3438767-Rhodomonas_salina.2